MALSISRAAIGWRTFSSAAIAQDLVEPDASPPALGDRDRRSRASHTMASTTSTTSPIRSKTENPITMPIVATISWNMPAPPCIIPPIPLSVVPIIPIIKLSSLEIRLRPNIDFGLAIVLRQPAGAPYVVRVHRTCFSHHDLYG